MEPEKFAKVHEFRSFLKATKEVEFTLDGMANYFTNTPFQKIKKSKNELIDIIKTEFADVGKPLAHIVPVTNYKKGISITRTQFMLLEDYIRVSTRAKSVLNCSNFGKYFIDRLPVFYNSEYRLHESLTTPLILLQKITWALECDMQAYISKALSPPKLGDLLPNVKLSEKFVQLIHLLPFIDPQSIMSDKATGHQFFVGVYNIMRLHILTELSKSMPSKNRTTLLSDTAVYQQFYYNIAGVNLCLNDIRYGILGIHEPDEKSNKNMKTSWICFKPIKKQVFLGFSPYDYRNRLVCGPKDGGLDVVLHSGAYYQSLTSATMGQHRCDEKHDAPLDRLKYTLNYKSEGTLSVDGNKNISGDEQIHRMRDCVLQRAN